MSASSRGSEQAIAALRARLASDPGNVDALVGLGSALRQLGRTDEAIDCFRRVLAEHPGIAEVWFNLGNALSAKRDLGAAIESYQQALALKPDFGSTHFNLGNARRDLGQLEAAEAAYRRALELMPGHVALHMNLGNLLRRRGRPDEAVALHRRALALDPQRHDARINLANALAAKGERGEAIGLYRDVITTRPGTTEAVANLAGMLLSDPDDTEADTLIARLLERDPRSRVALALLGRRRIVQKRWADADEALRRALEAGPDDAELHVSRGRVLQQLGEPDAAIEAYRQALAVDPDLVAAHNGLGLALQARGELGAAIEALRAAVRRQPDDADLLANLGMVLVMHGQTQEGIAQLRKAVRLDPAHVLAASNLGSALFSVARLGEAVAACEAAIRLEPDHANAYTNLANALGQQGRLSEAMTAWRRVRELAPDDRTSFSNLLFYSNYDSDMALDALAELHRGFGRRYETVAVAAHGNDRNPRRRLRVGYVSPDFRQHSVAYFFESLLTAHDPNAVEVTCYAAVKTGGDHVTRRLQSLAGAWRNILGLDDAIVAEQIRADRIDILVDLAGHTAGNGLGIFARKPAPIQVTYIGYPNTTGLARMDYRLTDARADPPDCGESNYTERLYRLPRCFLAYQPPVEAPPVTERPMLAAGQTTFGSFNALPKTNARTVAAWAAILEAVPNARLVLKNGSFADRATRERYREMFAAHGIAAARLELLPSVADRGGHLGLYSRIDIALDTFPYNGTTTTCEALWMGVPVIALNGDRHVARTGASLLNAVGLDELVAPSLADYIVLARELAGQPQRLAAISRSLRERVQASPLCDARGLTRAVEAAYRDMWERWCAGAP